ncbi:DHA1 family bicyclomycin/chloramphenicol resistance-like MFS transporter [Agromyces flavus]|uniref:DHA1 family bicyclomycin/chloramphenicol resistance-like MFS transporter n=1 Tax=Agromyces flavus TaxID=589382 RepID=A0A1H1XMC1_9MICO|nr:multidrug effflux MFS transporter [Agromyces flavus]MCP2366457.1 DHA1 family bicyclomycin/chloramphenicol resistance-like MFS transporter [Agromyces flavus]GGI44714.1 Bcr/CflA family drug resistance efflux transporter [Agromyces flavus]SDT10360.1 MFS transporter, DHA1 family, bicyclomycin/chloramphenicol resistance protein [Agromyces flavus]
MPSVTTPAPAPVRSAARLLPAVLLLLTVFGPISMDLYLPLLPALTLELDAATSLAQLTVTSCLFGLALGQLIAGPLSDRFGRRVPLLIGVAAYIVASIWCAVSPSVEALVVARLVQGLAGGVGLVIAQAAGRDLYSGGALIRFFGRLTVLSGLAAIVGPLLGGLLATVADWRGLFLFLAAIGGAILLAVALQFTETLPSDHRTRGGLPQTVRDYRTLLSDRRFVGAVLVSGFAYAAVFAYLAGATYVLQGIYGLSPQLYAVAFGLNSAGFMIFGWLAARATERWSLHGTLAIGLVMCAAGALGLLVGGLFAVPVGVVIASLFTMVGGVAATTPPTTTLALAGYPRMAGTASSLLGMSRFAIGGLVAPAVGIAGAATMLPLGIVTASVVVVAAASVALLVPLAPRDRDAAEPDVPTDPDPTPAAVLATATDR